MSYQTQLEAWPILLQRGPIPYTSDGYTASDRAQISVSGC